MCMKQTQLIKRRHRAHCALYEDMQKWMFWSQCMNQNVSRMAKTRPRSGKRVLYLLLLDRLYTKSTNDCSAIVTILAFAGV